jgi:hypothetical protein
MKRNPHILKTLAIAFLLSAAAVSTFAQTKPASPGAGTTFDAATVAKLEAAAVKFEKIFDANDLKAVVGQLFRMKDAGLAYSVAYTAPTDPRILNGKTQAQLLRLKAIYLVDAMYTIYFGKKADTFVERVAEIDQMVFNALSDMGESSMSWSAGPIEDEKKIQRYSAYWYEVVRAMPKSAENTELLVRGFYYNALEVLHLAAKSGLASGVTEEYRVFLNATLPLLVIADDMLGSFVDIATGSKQQEFWKQLNIDADPKTIKELKAVVDKPDGMIVESDLRKMLAIIAKTRDPLIAIKK